ncbi:helix-turn-helix domain-containing protein [Homoserinimonas sp. OAct 916]|uniref:helix-turn-helix domain-containing protein n=1 Tax=Homoserinimonas sp. OAct 916 TaxID=2211450 RepID=UPI000DBE0670|nr:helix-turn-helix transcriptional regulator [Homoserinimonas sp. OAct 916]
MSAKRSPAAQLVRNARVASGLTQKEFANRANTSQVEVSDYERGVRSPNYATFDRLLRAAGQRIIAVPGTRNDSSDTAEAIGDALEHHNPEAAFRHLLDYSDGLSENEGVDRVLLAVAKPAKTGSPLWDAAVAAVSDYWLSRDKLPLPHWIDPVNLKLPEPTALLPAVNRYGLAPDVDDVAEEFRKYNVLLATATLASV